MVRVNVVSHRSSFASWRRARQSADADMGSEGVSALVNYHLRRAGHPRRIANFVRRVRLGVTGVLLEQIATTE